MSDPEAMGDTTPSVIHDHAHRAPTDEPWGCCVVEVGGLRVLDVAGREHFDGMRCDACQAVVRPHGCGDAGCPLGAVEWVPLRRCGLAEAAHERSDTSYKPTTRRATVFEQAAEFAGILPAMREADARRARTNGRPS